MPHDKFRPEIICRDDSFCVHLPEWNISGEGRTLEEAYRHFEAQKNAMQERAKKFALAEFSPEPYPPIKRKRVLQELGLFFAKTVTLVFAVVFTLILLLPHIGAAVRNQIAPRAVGTLNHWALDFPKKINARLDRVTPEEQRQMMDQWERLLKRTAPIRTLFLNPHEEGRKAK